jgi:hypothetical protein
MDLTVDYLKRKKDLTDIEKRLLKRMMFINKDVQTDIEVISNNKSLKKVFLFILMNSNRKIDLELGIAQDPSKSRNDLDQLFKLFYLSNKY